METAVLQPVLVTGASGFIGGRLVRRLIQRGGRVSCLMRTDGRRDELRSIGAQVLTGDVTDRDAVRRALAESQAGTVFHVAGLVRTHRRGDFMRVNAGGVETVAGACAGRGDPPTLVVVSSLAAAGPCAADRTRVENDAPEPISHYGRSKLAGERAAAKHAGVVPTTIVRPPVVFGPSDRAMLQVFRPIGRWGVHVVPGWHDRRFSLVHVDDLLDGLLAAAERGERMGEHGPPGQGVYFMGTQEHPTYAEFGLAVAHALGRKPPTVLRVPGPALRVIGKCGDMAARIRRCPTWINSDKVSEALAESWTCSSAKARAHLAWPPSLSPTLADRLRETAAWYRGAGWL